ncbi:MAG: TIGR03936 family radical SAM-associated protein [Oscillospiraceae bacterium]
MNNIRIFFTKLDRAKYISHLDMYRLFMRCIIKSNLPVWYTEGFNPHMYMTFPLPLSLGFESDRECVDMRLIEDLSLDDVKNRLEGAFPMGIEVLDVAEQKMDQKEIAFADYEIKLFLADDVLLKAKESFIEFMKQESIIVLKKTKKKELKELDIKPLCSVLSCDMAPDCLKITLRCVTGISTNLNPNLLIDAFMPEDKIRYTSVKRIRIMNSDLEEFC